MGGNEGFEEEINSLCQSQGDRLPLPSSVGDWLLPEDSVACNVLVLSWNPQSSAKA